MKITSAPLLLFFSFFLSSQILGQEKSALDWRAEETATLFTSDPEWPKDHFAASFLELVPPRRMRAILRDYYARCGEVVGLTPLASDSTYGGSFVLLFEKDVEADLTIAVEPRAPHSITKWVISNSRPSIRSFEALGVKLGELPGTVSLSVVKLGEGGLDPVFSLQPDIPLAIGSAFKLYVLGALIDEIASKQRAWSQPIALEARFQSIPSGFLQNWPVGSVHTLETLAGLMISQSDNTAADHLLHALGRQRVESSLEIMGNRHAELSKPFLSTTEMFKLKWINESAPAKDYLELESVMERRAYLDEVVSSLSLEDLNLAAMAKPLFIDKIEWFASTADLCRAMNWLRLHTQGEANARARKLLSINPGLSVPKGVYTYVGFKGGSEPGVLNTTWLLGARSGEWFAISATWNDTKGTLDEARFLSIIGRVPSLLRN